MSGGTQANREQFRGKWRVAFALLGVAVGLGNVWRFPYMMGLHGGGAFLLVYLAVVVLFGIPALMAELALGRATRQGPLRAYTAAGLAGGKVVGWALFVGVGMAMSYYLVIVGWIVAFWGIAVGNLAGVIDNFSSQTFAGVHDNRRLQIVCSTLVAAGCAEVVGRGVNRGIARASSFFVPVFAFLMILLAIRSVTLPGAREGIEYLLLPDWSALDREAVLAATGQAFFSLGLGGTFFVIYGSYLSDDERLPRRALGTAAGDIAASLLAAFAIIPAVFATGLSPRGGPPLLFEVLPEVSLQIPAGLLFAVLFFAALGCVAFLSGVAAVEVLVGSLTDAFGVPRRLAAWGVCMVLVGVGYPAMRCLDYLTLSDKIWGSTMQPLGSVVAVAALAWGLNRRRATAQLAVANGDAPRWVERLYLWLKYFVPLGVLAALFSGWI